MLRLAPSAACSLLELRLPPQEGRDLDVRLLFVLANPMQRFCHAPTPDIWENPDASQSQLSGPQLPSRRVNKKLAVSLAAAALTCTYRVSILAFAALPRLCGSSFIHASCHKDTASLRGTSSNTQLSPAPDCPGRTETEALM